MNTQTGGQPSKKTTSGQPSEKTNGNTQDIAIPAPNLQTAIFEIYGTSPYVQARFSEKAKRMMREKQEKGTKAAKSKGTRESKDFEAAYKGAMYVSDEGWPGIPAGAFRTAMIDCCRLVNFKMTHAKLAIFVEPDGFDKHEATPLVRIHGNHKMFLQATRNATGVADIHPRPIWKKWTAKVRVMFDADVFSAEDIANLLMRAGKQCGIGEGRPNSRASTGIGFGTFEIK